MSLYQQAQQVVGDDPVAFMAELDSTLRAHGHPHAALARKAGVDPILLSKWFRGVKNPNEWSRLKLDDALNRLLYG
jgi:hypothetical protein